MIFCFFFNYTRYVDVINAYLLENCSSSNISIHGHISVSLTHNNTQSISTHTFSPRISAVILNIAAFLCCISSFHIPFYILICFLYLKSVLFIFSIGPPNFGTCIYFYLHVISVSLLVLYVSFLTQTAVDFQTLLFVRNANKFSSTYI